MSNKTSLAEDPTDFSLVLGGPLYQLYLRTRLAKPPLERLTRRLIGIPLIAWLPLLVLTLYSGHAIGGVTVPFVLDVDVHVRLLGALPLLIGAEILVHKRLRTAVRQFLDRGLIAPDDQARFDAVIASAMRLRNSVLLEVFLLVFTATAGYWVWKRHIALQVPTWFASEIDGRTQFTPAGYWYAFGSLTIFRFLFFRWYFRVFIWYRFLWQIARKFSLRLNPLHPDPPGVRIVAARGGRQLCSSPPLGGAPHGGPSFQKSIGLGRRGAARDDIGISGAE